MITRNLFGSVLVAAYVAGVSMGGSAAADCTKLPQRSMGNFFPQCTKDLLDKNYYTLHVRQQGFQEAGCKNSGVCVGATVEVGCEENKKVYKISPTCQSMAGVEMDPLQPFVLNDAEKIVCWKIEQYSDISRLTVYYARIAAR